MRKANEIITYSGACFDPFTPTAADIRIWDIAHALPFLCRANGHFTQFYSVGQHSLNCMREAEGRGLSPRIQLFALLHDATECYLSDITRPVKTHLPEYVAAEHRLMTVIFEALCGFLPEEEEWQLVREIDDTLLYHEFYRLRGEPLFERVPPLHFPLSTEFEDFSAVERQLLDAYELLAKICSV